VRLGGTWCDDCFQCGGCCDCEEIVLPANVQGSVNANDYLQLRNFADQGNNIRILGWNLRRPETWSGVTWCDSEENKRIIAINLSGLGLTGRLNLSGMTRLETAVVRNNQLTGIDVSGCTSLRILRASWNQLTEITTFDGLFHLFWVDVSYNNLDLSDPDMRAILERYRTLIEGNEGEFYDRPQHDGKLSGSLIEEILRNEEIVRIALDCGRIISIDPDSITEVIGTINLNIDVRAADKTEGEAGIPENAIFIRPAHHGQFGLELTFDISAEDLAEAGLNADTVRLFHVDDDGSVTEEGRIISRNADGSVTIGITHASYYVMSAERPCFCGECTLCGIIEELYRLGFVTEGEAISINDAIEILKWLVELPNEIDGNDNAFNAARITGEDKPTINDAIEILKWLVGLDSDVLDELYGKKA
jgi:hypothetical protein